jgi:hypothetical protein
MSKRKAPRVWKRFLFLKKGDDFYIGKNLCTKVNFSTAFRNPDTRNKKTIRVNPWHRFKTTQLVKPIPIIPWPDGQTGPTEPASVTADPAIRNAPLTGCPGPVMKDGETGARFPDHCQASHYPRAVDNLDRLDVILKEANTKVEDIHGPTS